MEPGEPPRNFRGDCGDVVPPRFQVEGELGREMRTTVAVVHRDEVEHEVFLIVVQRFEVGLVQYVEQGAEFMPVTRQLDRLHPPSGMSARLRQPVRRVGIADTSLPDDSLLAQIVVSGGEDHRVSFEFRQGKSIDDFPARPVTSSV